MRRARIALLAVLAAAAGCGGGADRPGGGIDVSGSWSGTMTDIDAARTISGNCTRGRPEWRCTFTVTDPGRGLSSQGVLTGVVTTNAMGSEIVSYYLGVPSPPCSMNVSGEAIVSGATWEATYAGMNSCVPAGVRDGRLSLRRQ